ncbi:MAG: DUF5663 domain-containing protein [Patescibacteria group bacterium]|nr:DUF5663 domain-containing protein [Patescibacteria group bacterium]
MSQQYDLAQFTDLFEELGLTGLTDDRKQELLGKVMELLELRINDAIYNTLTEEQVAQLDEIEEEDKIDAFLEAAIPNMEELATEESLKLRAELVAQAGNLDEELEKQLSDDDQEA